MTAPATAVAPAPPRPHLVVRGQDIPVILPSKRDPRLRLSAVIITLHVLGQTMLGFKVSVAQILITVAVGAAIDAAVTYRRQHVLAWPASGILTGSGVAFILRASGTENGDWWSLNGIWFFVLAVVLSLASKHLIRPGGRHVFNPSNVGLVWALLVIGPVYVFPQYLWWGPNDLGVALAYAVILAGGVWVLRPVRMAPMALAYLGTFAVLIAIFAATGSSFIAIWHDGPIEGLSYWANIALSPELLVFVFFMMSDPQTAPRNPRGRVVYGVATAVLTAGLTWFQPTEFGIKLAILSSLTVVCAAVPLIERLTRPAEASAGEAPAPFTPSWRTRLASAATNPVILAAAIITVAAPVNTAALAGNEQVILIERGLTADGNPQ